MNREGSRRSEGRGSSSLRAGVGRGLAEADGEGVDFALHLRDAAFAAEGDGLADVLAQ